MDLDLGTASVANVSVNGETHTLRLPTVMEADKFQQKVKKNADGSLEVFAEFVVSLGLPKEVVFSLDIHQFEKLSNGLLGMSEKK